MVRAVNPLSPLCGKRPKSTAPLSPQSKPRPGRALRCRLSGRARSGFGLTHTVLLMVVLGLLMGLAATVLGQSFLTYRQTMNHFQQFQTLQLSQSQFRSDAHNAINAQVQDQTLVLTMANSERVEYQSESGVLVRRLFQAEKQLGKQIWQLPGVASATWTVDRSGTCGLVETLIEFDNNADRSKSGQDAQSATTKAPKLNVMKLEPIQWSARFGVYEKRPSQQKTYAQSDTQPMAADAEEESP